MRDSLPCAAIFAAPSAQPRRHCLPAVDAIAPSANDTLFRRAPRSLRGFESEGRRQKNTRIHGCFFVPEKGTRTSARQFCRALGAAETTLLFFEDGIMRLNTHSLVRSVLRPDGRLFGVCLNTHLIFSKTESRAAQPNFHRRRSRRLKVAARSLSVARRPRLK